MTSETMLQLLSFSLSRDVYGIDITKVQEIRVLDRYRRLPNTPEHWIGVIDFRNEMVPVIDLRTLFDYDEAKIEAQTIVVVVSIVVNEKAMLLGVVVDSVSDVISLESGELKQTPTFDPHVKTEFIHGMFKYEEHLVVVVCLEALLSAEDIQLLKQQLGDSKSVV